MNKRNSLDVLCLIEQIDELLPQTQCGLCSYGGCRPYAEAIALQNEHISRCPPGGLTTFYALSKLLQIDPQPLQAEIASVAKPAMQARIQEDECIGCTKCIQACPVDAIIGSAKQMHTVLTTECTGCELCVAPCPVDCIDMVELPAPQYSPSHAKQRYKARQERLAQAKQAQTMQQQQAKQATSTHEREATVNARKAAIQEALARFKQKKSH